jgi:hypothetical protein
MKRLTCLLVLVFTTIQAHADNWLANGDFSDGISKWYGEAKGPADYAAPDPFTKADPFTSQGMIIPLKNSQWIKECQDFKGKGENSVLKITYVLSPDLKFTSRPEDYQNMPDKIGWDAWKAFDSPPNSWIVFISELEQRHGEYFVIQPDLTSTKEQTFNARVQGMTPLSAKTIALAFPPGNGTIVIHKIELLDQ